MSAPSPLYCLGPLQSDRKAHVQITEIRVYQQDQPLHEDRYTWSDGRSVEVFDSTVVELVTCRYVRPYGTVYA